MCPESARWLFATGQQEEAQRVCAQAARWNGKEEPTLESMQVRGNSQEVDTVVKMDQTSAVANSRPIGSMPLSGKVALGILDESNFLNLWRSPVLRKRTVCMCWQWLSVTLSYFGLTYASTDLSGEPHVNVAFSFVAEVIGFSLAILLLNWVGRRWLLILCQTINGLSCIIGGVLMTMDGTFVTSLSTVLCMLGKVGSSCAFAVIYLFTCELFSTPLRGQALGLFNFVARLGTISAFLIDLLKTIYAGLPTILMGSFALVAAVFALNFPETIGLPLPETCEDAVKLKDKTPIYGRFPRRLRDLL